MTATIRPGRDADAAGFFALIRACWGEYPSIVLDLAHEIPELGALARYYADAGGALWAAEADGRLVGMIAVRPSLLPLPLREGEKAWEICRLYLDAAQRGTGLAGRLLATAEAHAGPVRLVLWSDTRFTRAHRFYEKHSYVRTGPIRPLDDLSHSLEYGYVRPWRDIVVLDAACAASAAPRLTALLAASGAADAAVPPLPRAEARAHWDRTITAVATGQQMVLVAWDRGVLAATVTLDLDLPATQRHRAIVRTLLVDPAHRRRGLARALLARAEAEAAARSRRLLTLEAAAGIGVEPLFRTAGWTLTGRIPGGIVTAAMSAADALLFHKQLGDEFG